MSKTTKKYGKPLYTMTTGIDANPKPTPRMLEQAATLDKLARKEFGKSYDSLKGNEKTQLHFNINMGVYNTETK